MQKELMDYLERKARAVAEASGNDFDELSSEEKEVLTDKAYEDYRATAIDAAVDAQQE